MKTNNKKIPKEFNGKSEVMDIYAAYKPNENSVANQVIAIDANENAPRDCEELTLYFQKLNVLFFLRTRRKQRQNSQLTIYQKF